MAKNGCAVILVCLTLLPPFCMDAAAAEDYVKDVEIKESSIDISENEFPHAAYLYMELKNNGVKNIANLNLEVDYYDRDGYPLKKVILKNKLTESIPPGEERRYKMRLNGNVVNERNEEYPYSQRDEVGDFSVKILSVKLARK